MVAAVLALAVGEIVLAAEAQHPAPELDTEPHPLERTQTEIRENLRAIADRIDRFFGDERAIEEADFTNGRLSISTRYDEGDAPSTSVDLRGKLVLPRINQRLQLVFEGQPEDGDLLGVDSTGASASLRYLAREKDRNRIIIDGGGRGGLTNPSAFIRVLQRRTWERDEKLIRFTPSLAYDFRDGFEAALRLDQDWTPRRNTFFRYTSNLLWSEDEPGLRLDQNFTLAKRVSRTRSVAVDWSNTFRSEPHAVLENVLVQTRLRREVWRDKLFLELAPGIRFPRSESHRAVYTINLRLDLQLEP
ncbi:MAG: hypothetical protein ACFCUG_00540 [Thiotrichales bacterium]